MSDTIVDIKELFGTLLEIDKPWKLSKIVLKKSTKVVEAYIDFERGSHFECPVCGNKSEVHDTRYRLWRHLDIMDYRLHLLIKIPRIKCSEHGVKTIDKIPWGRMNSHFTHMFENGILHKAREMSVMAIAREVSESDNTLWRIIKYHISQMKLKQINFNGLHSICVDETSSKKGHKYVTIFTNPSTNKIVFVTEGKDLTTFDDFYNELQSREIHPNNIQHISMDMSKSFISGASTYFPKADITFDKFHVKKLLNESVDQVRKAESKDTTLLKRTKYLWLKGESKLSSNQKKRLEELLSNGDLKTAEAYRLKLLFDKVWTIHKSKVEAYLEAWCEKVISKAIEPMIGFVKTLKNHWGGVINIAKTKLSNGVAEGLNSLIQMAKSRARGFKNIDNFIDIIYLIGAGFDY